jgi:di/tricarboxylate transporter
LCAIVFAIVLGFVKQTNVGIIAIALVALLGKIYGLSTKEIMSGFNSSLFMTMLGLTYMFGILSENGTMDALAHKIVRAAGGRRWLIPIAVYAVGFLLTAAGPGSIPILAIIPVVSVPIALSSGLDPIMLAMIGEAGCFGGRMAKITPEGALVANLIEKQGVVPDMFHIWLSLFVTSLLLSAVIYAAYRPWKSCETLESIKPHEDKPLTGKQWLSLAGLLAMILGATVLKFNVGLIAFLVGTVLLLLGAANEKASMKHIPWGVLLLVVGVGILMNVVGKSGGIDLLVKGMTKMMNEHTASPLMNVIAGVMSLFSSGIGVVFPTLIPTVSAISSNFGGAVSPIELAAGVVIGGTVPGLSPISTTGALIMAAIAANETTGKHDQNKMFITLWMWAFAALAISTLLAYLGVYRMICGA